MRGLRAPSARPAPGAGCTVTQCGPCVSECAVSTGPLTEWHSPRRRKWPPQGRRTCRPAGPSSVPSVCADDRAAGAAGLGVPESPTFKLHTNQPRTQVGMLRQNNQHTPARAAVLAAVLRTLAALIGGIYYYKNGLKLKLKLGAVIAQRACKDPDTSPLAPFPHHHPATHRPVHSPAGLCLVTVECALDVADDPPGSNGQVSVQVRLPIRHG